MRTRVKICCIASIEEAKMAIDAGADALGLVAEMPSGPGPIDDATIATIARQVPPPIATFLLTCRVNAEKIIEHHKLTNTNTIQLVDHVPVDQLKILRAALPSVRLVQVIHVADQDSLQEARLAAPHVHALLLDSGRPKLAIKELGGTGRVHDWAISKLIVEQSPVPVFLAGGLNATNVTQAVQTVRPFGVDICSGVRTDGNLDARKLDAFMEAMSNSG
jgi:phosphoribosylanthranilate isomerase